MPFTANLPRDIRSRPTRRGPRMNSRVPVTIEWSGKGPLRFEACFTRVVSGYGCLLVSPAELDAKQRFRLTNVSTRRSADAVVVWKGVKRPDGWDLGVELASTELDFWGIEL